MVRMVTIPDSDVPDILLCDDGHLHCLDCGTKWPHRGPIMLAPATNPKTGERAMSFICTRCAVMMIIESYLPDEDEDDADQPQPLIN